MRKKKIAAITMVLLMMLTLGFTNLASVKASTEKSTSKKWAAAYMKIIKKLNKEDKAREKNPYVSNDSYTYDLIYFNNDSIPELVVSLPGYWVSMYTYDKSKSKVYTVMDQWAYGAGGNAGYSYLPKKNVLSNMNSDYAGAVQYVYYGKMKKHKIVSRYPKELKIQYFKDKNKNGYPDEDEYTEKPYYFYGEKQISKKKFKSYEISGKYKDIIGSVSYKKMKKTLSEK